MAWVFALLALVLLVALGLVIAGRLPAVPQPTDGPQTLTLPAETTAADLDALRFPVVFRGYRMQDVDAALLILRQRIEQLESTEATVTPDAAPVAGAVPFAPPEVDSGQA